MHDSGVVGLSEQEAARRRAELGEEEAPPSSRSYSSIVVANVFTLFNGILACFGALTLAFGDPRDALFVGVIVANAGIGIVQEVRAKRTLDRLSALVAPTARVVRDGRTRDIGAAAVVPGDLVTLAGGDQLVADGRLVSAAGLRLDESILTGESEAVPRQAGDEIRSGAFVTEGVGRYVVTAVGEASYAQRIAGQARAFRHPRSPLEEALNRVLLALVAVLVPLGLLLFVTLLVRDTSLERAVPKATAAMVSLVPEGLILLASLTFAVAAVRMARRGALTQQLNAIESLASVDVICLDKTGTLTEPTLRVVDAVPVAPEGQEQLEVALSRIAANAAARNLTLGAIAERWPARAETPLAQVPFSSRYRWSAIGLADGTLVLGAPEVVPCGALSRRAAAEAAAGRRVLAVAGTDAKLEAVGPSGEPPEALRPLGLVVLAEQLRPDAAATVEFLRGEGVDLKVLSGDAPATVAAIARDVGITSPEDEPLDGRRLPADADELRRLALGSAVVGRISPEGKRQVVEALRDAGRYVAMVGDGVNDVPALKASRLAIAQGSGTQMAKSVSDIVLISGDFATVPHMVAEGRRILRNVQRVAKLFVSKAAFAALLILTVGMTTAEYPFLPRHLTLGSTFSVGLPAFFLALAPSHGPWKSDRFLRDVARFAIPGGVAVGLGVLAGYWASLHLLDLSVTEARTVSTTALLTGMLFLVIEMERAPRRRRRLVELLALVMLAGYAVALSLPFAREFFALAAPSPEVVGAAAGASGVSWTLAALLLWTVDRWRRPQSVAPAIK